MNRSMILGIMAFSIIFLASCAELPYLVDHKTDKPLAMCGDIFSVILVSNVEGAEFAALQRTTEWWNEQHPQKKFFRPALNVSLDIPEHQIGVVFIEMSVDPENSSGANCLGITVPTVIRYTARQVACISGARILIRKGMSIGALESTLRHELGHAIGLNDVVGQGVMQPSGFVDTDWLPELNPDEASALHTLYPPRPLGGAFSVK